MVKEESPETDFSPALMFLRDEETRGPLMVFGLVIVLVTAKIFYSMAIKDSYLHDEVRFEDEWELSFSEETTTLTETVLVADGARRTLNSLLT